ncbi:hypothetical protein [Gymnodinialimonas ulvae]|uniref:hypothetical protein n=1 Tax=Gymnodinialimonas ulvae TaxID=3126504 RepID=UPI0030A9147B
MDHEILLETVLSAVMDSTPEPLALLARLRKSAPDARLTALIRALLSADQVISETFNGSSPGRADAILARSMALTLAEAGDEVEAETRPGAPLRLSDLSI